MAQAHGFAIPQIKLGCVYVFVLGCLVCVCVWMSVWMRRG